MNEELRRMFGTAFGPSYELVLPTFRIMFLS